MRQFGQLARRHGTPVTFVIIGLLLGTFLLAWLGLRELFGQKLLFSVDLFLGEPWRIFTFPFASAGSGNDLFWFMLTLLWVYWMGGSVEREVGSKRFAGIWIAFTLLTALAISVGSLLFSMNWALGGPMIVSSSVTAIWCARHRFDDIYLMAAFRIKGLWLFWFVCALIIFSYGDKAPLLGVFAVFPVVVAWFYGRDHIAFASFSATSQRKDKRAKKMADAEHGRYMASIKEKEQEREERERLRRLFESSLEDDGKQ